jgi:hypothetical protein
VCVSVNYEVRTTNCHNCVGLCVGRCVGLWVGTVSEHCDDRTVTSSLLHPHHCIVITASSSLHPHHCIITATPTSLHHHHYTVMTAPSSLHQHHWIIIEATKHIGIHISNMETSRHRTDRDIETSKHRNIRNIEYSNDCASTVMTVRASVVQLSSRSVVQWSMSRHCPLRQCTIDI